MYFVSLTLRSSSRKGCKFEFLKYIKLLSTVTLDSIVIFVQLCFPLKEQQQIAKSHKERQLSSKFMTTSVCDIFKESNLMDHAILWAASFCYTNWPQIFSSWLAKDDLSPADITTRRSRKVNTRRQSWVLDLEPAGPWIQTEINQSNE